MNLPQDKPKKMTATTKWFIAFIALFILAASAGALFAASGYFDAPKPPPSEGMLSAKDKANIMIMGVDSRADDVGRSDTLMVATIDPKKDQASLLSIPRDTRVKIKNHGFDKINHAYAFGGHELTKDTVENFLGVTLDHYIIIDTHAFQRIIDTIGGIDIDVEKRMYYEDPWDDDGGLIINLQPGMQHMDGKTAITYVRYRDEEGDLGRIQRQQKFMKAIFDKIASPSIIMKIPSIIKEVSNSIKTDMSIRQMIEFAGTIKESQKNGLKTDMVPGRPLYIDEISYWIPNIKELRQTLANALGLTMNMSMTSSMERQILEYENSIPATAKPVPATDTSIGHATKRSEPANSSKQSKTAPVSKDKKSSSDSKNSDAKPLEKIPSKQESGNAPPSDTQGPAKSANGPSVSDNTKTQ
ncbi:transcriptional attenuator, LytR family [Propionispira arboris]|uniref:Transcriptional attenuator, LytR family n=1 Tax=Propionispira arboris TaxID=84035 RepID=A0A1H7BEZ6_9FIRM|nr:LCP family protein [Propionispira arboris]SEJ72790.1 transcriptional attenuator, LytR family [Propionispira arboris]